MQIPAVYPTDEAALSLLTPPDVPSPSVVPTAHSAMDFDGIVSGALFPLQSSRSVPTSSALKDILEGYI